MADLNSIGSRISKVGENVGTRLDGIAKKFLDSTNLKVDLQNVFQETGLNTAKLNEKMNELQLPEVYKNAASFLVQNQKAFEWAETLPDFLQVLLDTQADKFLGSVDSNAIPEIKGGRSDDATLVVGMIQNIVRLKAKYTPQDNNFDLPYRYSAQGVMIKQDDGSYLSISENKKRIPEEATYKNIISNMVEHINGLSGGPTAVE